MKGLAVKEELGRGAFGVVHRAVAIGNGVAFKEAAIKTIHCSDEAQREALQREVNLLREVDHPATLRLLHTFEQRGSGTVQLALELCRGSSLGWVAELRRRARAKDC